MMNYIWGIMILVGILYGTFTGRMSAVSNAALDSAGEAVSLCVVMFGVMGLWVGLMKIAEKTGLVAGMTKAILPFLRWLFPGIPIKHPAMEQIAVNSVANILGLGWAATPAGLKAMEHLGQLNRENCKKNGGDPKSASREMCTFLILNISSLQMIPVNMIAYRSQYQSPNPTAIVAPAILATCCSTLTAILYCKWKCRNTSLR